MARKKLSDGKAHPERLRKKTAIARKYESKRLQVLKLHKMELEAQNKELREAHREVLTQVWAERRRMKLDIAAEIEESITPILNRLEKNHSADKNFKFLRNALERIVGDFRQNLGNILVKLSPRELEICNMLKSGTSTKEIASLLGVAVQTVEKQRKNIRKKFGLTSKSANLVSFLRNL